MVKHTAESLRKYSADELKNLRTNALRLGASDVASLCDSELQRRKLPRKPAQRKISMKASPGTPVRGFHFVCPDELGVTKNADGTFSTGIWAVAEAVADRARTVGAYIALHNNKSERSYLQGTLKSWRQLERKGKAIPHGIEFIVEPSHKTRPWRGDGAGEKGYFYGDDEGDDE